MSQCFRVIQEAVLESAAGEWKGRPGARIVREECRVRLPLRLNWGEDGATRRPTAMKKGARY